ncbi:hypothetical protein CC78DRAFT_547510 [Lojkania enalia]|uniref:Uncharacterized protein n=1 Tax=Lojkania enalia TaxID=147567 RepID=A0A9P4K3Y1_9PLEO|nr:hypothetical protein CC78DRAFT_547510 [Didymosphaeria enalia]
MRSRSNFNYRKLVFLGSQEKSPDINATSAPKDSGTDPTQAPAPSGCISELVTPDSTNDFFFRLHHPVSIDSHEVGYTPVTPWESSDIATTDAEDYDPPDLAKEEATDAESPNSLFGEDEELGSLAEGADSFGEDKDSLL